MNLKTKTTPSNNRILLVRDRKEAREKTPFRRRSRRNRDPSRRPHGNPRRANTRQQKGLRTTSKPVLHGCENSRFCPGTSELNEPIPESRQKRKKEKNEKLEPGLERGPNIEKLPGIPNGHAFKIRSKPEKPERVKCRYGPVKRNPYKRVNAGPKRLTDRFSYVPAEIPHPSSTDSTHFQTVCCFIDRSGDGMTRSEKKTFGEHPTKLFSSRRFQGAETGKGTQKSVLQLVIQNKDWIHGYAPSGRGNVQASNMASACGYLFRRNKELAKRLTGTKKLM